MIASDYGEGADGTIEADAYNEAVTGYDMNGNILGVVRNQGSLGEIDKLSLSIRWEPVIVRF